MSIKELISLSSEHKEQKSLFVWAMWHAAYYPELALMFAIPNGGKRDKIVALKLKEEGVRPGVPDVFLPVARKGWHGLFIELKWGYGKPSPDQALWLAKLVEQGYLAVACWGWQQAAEVIKDYLGISEDE